MLLKTVHDLATQTLKDFYNMKFQDVEIAITLIYTLAEAIPVSDNALFTFMVIYSKTILKIQFMKTLSFFSRISMPNMFFKDTNNINE